MQVTIARQLGLDPSTVSNFFMNARRRSVDKWREDSPPGDHVNTTLTVPGSTRTLYVTNVSGDTIVHHIGDHDTSDLSPSSLSSPGGTSGHQLDLWHDLSVAGSDSGPGHTAVYIIPRSLHNHDQDDDPDSPGAVSDHVILEDNEEILETDEEVLDDDEILDPPD